MFASKTLRTLALAAALMSPVVAGSALADGEYVAGPTAVGSLAQGDSRTVLVGCAAQSGAQSLEQSGATGGGGQHS